MGHSIESEFGPIRRVVIKVGTRVLTGGGKRLHVSRLVAVAEVAADLRQSGRDVILVSSGAVGLGRRALGIPTHRSSEPGEREACAAVGQSRLMGLYQDAFAQLDLVCGQILLTEGAFDDRHRYLQLRDTLTALLRCGVVPVINEDDAVPPESLGHGAQTIFAENDRLAALVATKLGADLLVLLTDVDGLYDRDPRQDPTAQRIARLPVNEIKPEDSSDAAPGEESRGGMRSKLEAASIASRSGCHALIASGNDPQALMRFLSGEDVGTWIPCQGSLDARKRWIAFAAAARGALHLDEGAVRALRERQTSLLAVGVRRVEGDFHRGDIVELRDSAGVVIGRGLMHFDADTAREWCSGRPPEDVRSGHALIRRDELVLEVSKP